jgi:Concanavalin A-like lectin/glucanases superfamily
MPHSKTRDNFVNINIAPNPKSKIMKTQNLIHCVDGRLPIATSLLLMMAIVTARADYQSTVLADHPIAYFPLNDITNLDTGSGTTVDLSGNGNNSSYSLVYPATGPSAYITNAGLFLGSAYGSSVNLGSAPNAGVLNFGGPITMEAWVQSTNITQGPADILGKGYDSTINDDELVLRANANGAFNYYGGTYNNTNNGASASGGIQTTNWTYLVSTYDGTNWNLYVNGILVGHGADSVGAINFPDPWAIGTGSADGASRYFQGNICQVALYTNALSQSQVLNHLFMGFVGVMPSNAAPLIVSQPQAQSAYAGGTAAFSVTSVSPLLTTNQWYKNGSPIVGQTNATLTLNNVQVGDVADYSVRVGNSNGFTNSVSASFTLLASGNSLRWGTNANNTGGTWDAGISKSWINVSNNQQSVFNDGDQVLFDDTPGVPTNVTVSGTVSPSVMTVNSSTNNFNISGGTISGSGSLLKKGSSVLDITSSGNFTGPVGIEGGVIYAGNNCFGSVSSIVITNNSTLDIGGGALGGNKPVTVSGTGFNGEGAIFNSYEDYPVNQLNITMAGDTTFGCTARWDLGAGSQITGPYNLTIHWADTNNPYGEWTSVTIGSNVAGITLASGSKLGSHNMDSGFQNPATVITVQTNSQLIFWNGGWNGTVHLLGGGQAFQFGAPGAFNGYNVIMENGAVWNTYGGSGDQSINVPITLNGVARFVIGDNNRLYTNIISGVGGFVEDVYNHAMILSAANTYTGPTIIGSDGNTPEVTLTNNGSISHSSLIFFGGSNPSVAHMDVTGRSDQSLTLASGQTLAGVGGVNGSIVVSTGATLSPSGSTTALGVTWGGTNAVGTIAASGNITLNGTTVIKLNGSGTNDAVQAGGKIIYGGTLNLVNISSSSLAPGDTFQIFNAANHTGSFANITPTVPGPGVAWDTNQLGSGIISVVTGPSQPVIGSTTILSGNLIFSGTGGAANGTYYVLTSTNLATPLADWKPLSTNAFGGSGNFSVTNAINPGNPRQFYLIEAQ